MTPEERKRLRKWIGRQFNRGNGLLGALWLFGSAMSAIVLWVLLGGPAKDVGLAWAWWVVLPAGVVAGPMLTTAALGAVFGSCKLVAALNRGVVWLRRKQPQRPTPASLHAPSTDLRLVEMAGFNT